MTSYAEVGPRELWTSSGPRVGPGVNGVKHERAPLAPKEGRGVPEKSKGTLRAWDGPLSTRAQVLPRFCVVGYVEAKLGGVPRKDLPKRAVVCCDGREATPG